MTRRARTRLLASALAALVGGGVLAATPQAPAPAPATPAPAATEVGTLDVAVADASGAAVVDLAAADFAVTIDGQPRVVSSASYVAYPVAPVATAEADDEGFVSNQGGARPRLVVFVMDEGQIRAQAKGPMVDAALALLGALRPGDLAAVVRLPRMTQGADFTTDREAVRAALSQTTGRAAAFASAAGGITLGAASEFLRGTGQLRDELLQRACGLGRGEQARSSNECVENVRAESQALVDDLTLRARDSAYGLERVMDRLAPLPGAKHVVLFSEAIFVGANQALLARAEAGAAKARATVIVVQLEDAPRDTVATVPFVAADPTAALLAAGLQQLGAATGGAIVKVGRNGGVDRLLGAMAGQYTLALEVRPGDRDGRAHAVTVQVARPGLTTSVRRAFAAESAVEKKGGEDRVRSLLSSAIGDATVPMRAAILVSPVAGGKVRTFVQSILDIDGSGPKDVEAAAAVLDATGTVVASFGLEPALLNDGDPRRGLVLGGARDIEPGEYRIRVAAVLPDGRAGSLEAPLAAKARQAGDVSFSDLLVGLRPPAGQAFRPVPEPVVSNELLMAVELSSAEADTTGGAEVQFEIAEKVDSEPLVAQPVEVPQGRRVATASASLQLTLPPGVYVARARVVVPGAEPAMLARRFVVASGAGGPILSARVDQAATPPPAVAPFDRQRALSPEVLAPFVDHVAKAFPQGNAGQALLAKAKSGQFDAPPAKPSERDALSHALVRGFAALRDGNPGACVTAFNEAIDQAGGFIGLALFQGDCYAAGGHDRDAVAAWQMALLGNVAAPAIYEQLVDGLLRIGEPQQALDALAEGDLVWLDRVGFDRRRGLALALLDRHQEALPLLEKAASDPSATGDLLFVVMRSMHAGRKAGWLEPGADLRQRYDGYLQRYTAVGGPQAALARDWRKGMEK
jgi:VWFA-related protein